MAHPRVALLAAVAVMLAGAAPAHAATTWLPYAPYVDMARYPPPDLPAIQADGGVRHITLGFVTARLGRQCRPTWGGYAAYPAEGSRAYRLANVAALRRAGGDVVPSFGGQAGTELARACRSVPALAAAYAAVIRAYRATRVDFDIEGTALGDGAANTRRARAIAQLQRDARAHRRTLRVSYTVPVVPAGLESNGRALIRNAVSHGVSLTVINIMAMDYGDEPAPDPAGKMGAYAIQAAQSLHRQLGAIFPRLGPAARWRLVGVTPMLGINDVPSEVFTLDDARQVVEFARIQRIGMLGMWELARDAPCSAPVTTTQDDCSGVPQQRWEFSQVFGTFTGS